MPVSPCSTTAHATILTLIHKLSILPSSAGVQGRESHDGVSGCPRKPFFLFSCRLRRREKKGKVGRPHTLLGVGFWKREKREAKKGRKSKKTSLSATIRGTE